jgi:peptidoglycan hydrolase-like protein with peptidoglycan-binding domain
VQTLQRLLERHGIHVTGGADGYFGKATASALRKFQSGVALPASGRVDEATAVAVGLIAPTPHLAPGAVGKEVSQLQQRLRAAGVHVKGGVDGQFGPGTKAALTAFQKANHLPVSGTLDAWSAAVLATRSTVATRPVKKADTTLAPGASGPAVVTLQRQLIAVGARPAGGADGQYGTATRRAVARFQQWSGLPVTGVVDARTLAALKAAVTPTVRPLASFPLPRTCTFWDTWGAPRAGGRHHEGTDIFARLDTPVLAVADGRIVKMKHDFAGSRGGNQFWLRGKDGTTYFYGHLDGFADGIGVGVPVRAGQTLGYAGKTGLTTVVHLHFEVHPGGGGPVNPYPILRATARC